MGMAASQARFLNLTAKKTNIEYHGQQINQQRTELSNASASLYNQMLTLQVPVPPNTQDFTKVQYSFTIPGSYDTVATVTQFSKTTTPGEYTVLFNYTEKELGFPACTTKQRSDVSNTQASSETYLVYENDATVCKCRRNNNDYQLWDGSSWVSISEESSAPPNSEPRKSAYTALGCSSSNKLWYCNVNGVERYYTKAQLDTLAAGSPGAESDLSYHLAENVGSKGGNYADQSIVTNKGKSAALSYVASNDRLHKDAYDALSNGGTEAVWVANIGTEDQPIYQYYIGSEIAAAKGAGEDNRVTYYTADNIDVFKEDSYTGVTLSRDGNNRVQSFSYKGEDYAVTANTVTDDESYNQAMNEYTYQSYLYEQEMNNINAKISVIHAQDRELELKLKQLDTEHNAVQTEIETVKSICKKNVEDSFKTFA